MDLRSLILGAADLPREKVPCPEWGCDVWVKTLPVADKDDFEQANRDRRGKDGKVRNFRAHVAALCVCDENGDQVFGPADADALGRKSSKALSRVCDVAFRLNGWTDDDVKELEKN
jgi:hypothetical protein